MNCAPITPLEVDWNVAIDLHEPFDKHEEPVEPGNQRHSDNIVWDQNSEE
jgi:hypothetical protein